ncbi:MAG: hypothetical protein RL217_1768 [Pseudomonadota bacterium]|jgi:RNA polymerase sigma-70 factor (ECF subfamily)
MNTAYEHFKQQLVLHLPALRRYGYALTGNKADADDLLQACAEKALERWQQYQADTHLDRWLYRLCRNHWIDTLRRSKPCDSWEEDAGFDPQSLPLEHCLAQELNLAKVQEQLAQLSDGLRTVLYLVAVEGRSYQETADMLDIPTGTVMSRLARARQQLILATGGAGALL